MLAVVDPGVDGQHNDPGPKTMTPAVETRMLELLERIVAALERDAARTQSPVLDANELAHMLQLDIRTLRRWEHEGIIPASVMLGRAKRWRRSDVVKWIEARRA